MVEKKRAVVIGANGFIGSHLVDSLALAGHEVTAFDRFSAGTRLYREEARQLRGDFLNTDDLREAVQGQQLLFHFLSTSTPATAERDPSFDVRTNVTQSIELMRLAVEAGVEHVYFASTGGAIYGESGRDSYSEFDPTLPISPYAIGKLSIENYLRYFRTKYALESTTFRISNPFGPRQHVNRKQGLIPIVLRQIALGLPVTQLGDGSMVRDYVYVEDLVEMIQTVVHQGSSSSVYNLGSGEGRSVASVLATIREVVGSDFEVVEAPKPATFVDRITLNINRYIEEFSAPNLTDFATGVDKTWQEVRSQCR
ncbi:MULTISPECIES: NAD-dependent epimerase/dehydratase family protein [unclassified Leucobacter]|uniref:NAD-dependent epimerase/dehydratase family protein n=1 Tax=unclassified Leucobacter TaxID=2621730 RepID=UPI00165D5CF0|nr:MULTISPECIES: NAD-dependent epimerase/dehydratase family protein [unclassified Leucobacter]MBC9936592.1 NAD-dependent epimerase/dehydratase family protein [Leucobacter sp. cx-87]